jgi:uncharacterized protein Smg (DUF494 family)
MDVDKDAKLHNNRDWMFNSYITMGMSVEEISNTLNISKKLVLIRLQEFGLV